MKTIFLLAALGLATNANSQYYATGYNNIPTPSHYPGYGYSQDGYYGNDQYGNDYDYYDDDFYDYAYNNFPQDYYYNYPTDYYPSSYYNSFYNDYRKSIVGINWKNFFIEFNLSPIQIQQITIINNRFPSYNSWYSYYGMNPNRWYYDRFYMLERILGPRIYLVFQQRYYHNMSPVVYFQNYNIRYYKKHYHCRPKYKKVVVNNYYVGRDRFFVDNPRYTGFRNGHGSSSNSGSGSLRSNIWTISTDRNSGFRDKNNFSKDNNDRGSGFRDNSSSGKGSGLRNEGFKTHDNKSQSSQNKGFRGGNESSTSTTRNERPSGGFRNEGGYGSPQKVERENKGFRGGNSNNGGGFRSESRSENHSSVSESGRRGGFR